MAVLAEAYASLSQGSIVDGCDFGLGGDNPLGVVLSNECDIRNDKAGFIIVACLVPAAPTILSSHEFNNKIEGGGEDKHISKKKWDKLKPFLDNYIYNKGVTRYYFIDASFLDTGLYLLADFQHLVSVPISMVNTLRNVAQVPSPYREQMMVQFASYTARIPVERVEDTSEIAKSIVGQKYSVD